MVHFRSLFPVALAATVALSVLQHVDAHGFMAIPSPRPMTAKYRANAPANWAKANDEEVQRAPLENFSGGTADFYLNNGCRGMEFEAENPVVELTPGKAFNVVWLVQASHPGPTTLSVARPRKNGTHVDWVASESVPMTVSTTQAAVTLPKLINGYGRTDAQATLPAALTGCTKPGDCTLQWYWDAGAINQHYYTCADFIVKGGAASGGNAGADSNTDTDADAEAEATKPPAAATAPSKAPASSKAPTPPASPKPSGAKCTRRARK